jgi:small redox-active disulfide protein 2
MEIRVLGSGCANCTTLYKRVQRVVERNNIDATVIYEKNLERIMEYNIMVTPAMVINDKVVVKGRVPSEKEILEFML